MGDLKELFPLRKEAVARYTSEAQAVLPSITYRELVVSQKPNLQQIRFLCECGKEHSVRAAYAGRKAKCKCGRVLVVPAQPEEEERLAEPVRAAAETLKGRGGTISEAHTNAPRVKSPALHPRTLVICLLMFSPLAVFQINATLSFGRRTGNYNPGLIPISRDSLFNSPGAAVLGVIMSTVVYAIAISYVAARVRHGKMAHAKRDSERLRLLSTGSYALGSLLALFSVIVSIPWAVLIIASVMQLDLLGSELPALERGAIVAFGSVLTILCWATTSAVICTGYFISLRRKRVFCLVVMVMIAGGFGLLVPGALISAYDVAKERGLAVFVLLSACFSVWGIVTLNRKSVQALFP